MIVFDIFIYFNDYFNIIISSKNNYGKYLC